MADFSIEIANYKNYGVYAYKFDSVGNELLNPSSSTFQQVYFAVPFENVVYDEAKMALFYDATFKEFIPITSSQSQSVFPQEAIDEINAITYDNLQLQNQLLAIVNASEQDSGAADAEAVKNIIISLRIQLGQGTTSSDFDTIFPYLPIPVELKDSTTSVQVVPSSAVVTIQPTITTTTTITSNTEQPAPTSAIGELTDSEKAAISASAEAAQQAEEAGVQYVIALVVFGTAVIARTVYNRIVLADGPGITSIANPIHGKYIKITDKQLAVLTNGQILTISGKKYKNVGAQSINYWSQLDTKNPNGNTTLQNAERWNSNISGTSRIPPGKFGVPTGVQEPNAHNWTREEQIGYLGSLSSGH